MGPHSIPLAARTILAVTCSMVMITSERGCVLTTSNDHLYVLKLHPTEELEVSSLFQNKIWKSSLKDRYIYYLPKLSLACSTEI